MKKHFLFCIAINFLSIVYGQDYHPWSEHFGAKASLLGGAATSGLNDNATVYYNAAAMAFVDDPSASLSVNAYRFSMVNLENALGKDLDLSANNLATFPNLISGILEFEKAKRLRLGYGVLTKRNYSNKYDFLHSAEYDILDTAAGTETYVAGYNWSHQISEYWGGFGLSYQLNDQIAFGFSHYGSYRDVKYNNTHEMNVLPNDLSTGNISSVVSNISLNYWNVKILFKPCFSFRTDHFRLGVAYTTPTINIMGKANVYREFSIINMNEIVPLDITFIDRAEKLDAVHKENGALAIGLSWTMGNKSWMHFSHELFFAQPNYTVFNANQTPNTYPTGYSEELVDEVFGPYNFMELHEETRAIMNFGLGFESQLNKKWKLFLGARTDFLTNPNPYYAFKEINIDASKWNLYHFSSGASYLTKKGKHYTIGIEYGFTPKQRFYHLMNFREPTLETGLTGEGSTNAFATLHSFKAIVEIELKKADAEKKPSEIK